MSKKRLINTKFWSDNFIVKLQPLERYLFFYLLSNEHTEICGIYELPIEVMVRETSLPFDTISNGLILFNEKIYYVDGWVYIKNFTKNQCANEKMKIGAKRSLDNVPENIFAKLSEKGISFDMILNDMDMVSISSDKVSIPYDIPKPKLKLKIKLTETQSEKISDCVEEQPSKENPNKEQPTKKELNEKQQSNDEPGGKEPSESEHKKIIYILDLFRVNNPAVSKMYGNTTYRGYLVELFKKYGFEKTTEMVKLAILNQKTQFCPIITNPSELYFGWTKLESFLNKINYKTKKHNPFEGLSDQIYGKKTT